jgi:hypothetical protein
MKRAISLLSIVLFLTVMAAQAANSPKINGWISDSMCGAKHVHGTKTDVACVTKCIQSGMKPVFVDTEKQVWAIDNPDAVKSFYGEHVKVTATEDAANKSVHIDSITAAK